MLRITIQENEGAMAMKLEGRIAGPNVAELSRVWMERAPFPETTKLSLDLRDVIYADDSGRRVLREIYTQTNAELVTGTQWTHYLAAEIMAGSADRYNQEAGNANNA
jgi:anti-anti-sigma regulatory factor